MKPINLMDFAPATRTLIVDTMELMVQYSRGEIDADEVFIVNRYLARKWSRERRREERWAWQ